MLVSNYAWMMMASLSTVFGDVRSDVILYSLSEQVHIIHWLLLLLLMMMMMMMMMMILTPEIIDMVLQSGWYYYLHL